MDKKDGYNNFVDKLKPRFITYEIPGYIKKDALAKGCFFIRSSPVCSFYFHQIIAVEQ